MESAVIYKDDIYNLPRNDSDRRFSTSGAAAHRVLDDQVGRANKIFIQAQSTSIFAQIPPSIANLSTSRNARANLSYQTRASQFCHICSASTALVELHDALFAALTGRPSSYAPITTLFLLFGVVVPFNGVKPPNGIYFSLDPLSALR